MPKLFISYRRKSWPFTHRLADELKRRLDAKIFVDLEDVDDDDFEHSILRHLRQSAAMLLIISEHTFTDRIHRDDDWVRREIREALTHDIPIVLVSIEDRFPPADLPDDIRPVAMKQGIRFYPDYFSAAVDKLAGFIETIGAAEQLSPSQQLPAPSTSPEDDEKAQDYQMLNEALRLLDDKDYAKAIFLLETLQEKNFRGHLVNIERLLDQARVHQALQERKRYARLAYQEIAMLAESRFTAQEARTAWQDWQDEYGDLIYELDAHNLRDYEWPEEEPTPPPVETPPAEEEESAPPPLVEAYPVEVKTEAEAPVADDDDEQPAETATEAVTPLSEYAQEESFDFEENEPLVARDEKPERSRVWVWGGLLLLLAGLVGVAMLVFSPDEDASTDNLSKPVLTIRPTRTPSPTATPLPNFPTPNAQARQLAERSVSSNAEWEQVGPVSQIFNGVEMVLVPGGCFMMGSEDGADDERPVHEVCFDAPFWIDRYEVTNEQYGSSSSGNSCYYTWHSEPDRPRNCVSWFEANDFCTQRGARLPTEAEWEYAARGPDSLVYPWGNTFVENNVVYEGNSHDRGASVSSHSSGVSWVGTYNASGNVWEWTNSIYDSYPYDSQDGREDWNNTNVPRVLRGGSFLSPSLILRPAYRIRHHPNTKNISYGFRCARSY